MLDEPVTIDVGDGNIWSPENFEGKSTGHDVATSASTFDQPDDGKARRDLGMPLVVEYAKRFGVYDNLPPFLSMSLGAGETTVLRMVTAYSMFANGGKRIKATLIDRIQDRWGNTIYRHDERICEGCDAATWDNQHEPKLIDKREQVIDPITAYQITSILQGVIQRGTGIAISELGKRWRARPAPPTKRRTSGSSATRRTWHSACSWATTSRVRWAASAQAALYTAPIFRDFMKMALKDTPDSPFRVPPGTTLISINLHLDCARPGLARSWRPSSPAPGRPTRTAAALANRLRPRRGPRRAASDRSARGRAAFIERGWVSPDGGARSPRLRPRRAARSGLRAAEASLARVASRL